MQDASLMRSVRCLGLAGSLTAIATAAAQEAPSANFGGDFWTRSKLTGDWGGTRDQSALKGGTVDLNTVYTPQGVPSGGLPGVSFENHDG